MQVRRRLRRLKRLVYLGGITGTVIAVRRSRQRRAADPPAIGAKATWPPLVLAEEPVAAVGRIVEEPPQLHATAAPTKLVTVPDTTTEGVGETEPVGADVAWVAPVGGVCPVDHPVKANDNSGIYHVPGGRFYERTTAERCYVDAAAAEADGYRAAKGS
jgi:hypothetical protein